MRRDEEDPLSRNFPSGVALLPPVLNEEFSRADRDQALTFSRDCASPNEAVDAPQLRRSDNAS